ncbi:MAG: FAD binding domain-containing protein [Methyloligellaceae bacterium]
MKPAPFTLHRPKTLEDAAAILADVADEGGLVLAGGQSLVPMMALRAAYPPDLVDINGIAELGSCRSDDGNLVIGATVRHARFHKPIVENRLGRLLATVSRNISHYPIRMRGTFCGSLAHADPASEWCLVSVTLGAELRLVSVQGARSMAANDFIEGVMTTVKEANEIIAEARLPLLSDDTTFGFYEFNRRAGDFALGMSLVTFALEDGLMTNVRVGIGGIEEIPRRVGAAEVLLEGKTPGDDVFDAAGSAAAQDVDPMQDMATSADYRRDLTAVVVRRALEAAHANQSKQG